MADLISMSTDIIDRGIDHGPINRINHSLSELSDHIAIVEAFSHSVVFDTDEGLVVFDTSGAHSGQAVVKAIRGWSDKPFKALVYTHGHVDHVGGSGAFIEEGSSRGHAQPKVLGHVGVARRFDRYRLTDGYNNIINARQFKGFGGRGYGIGGEKKFLPEDVAEPTLTYRDDLTFLSGECEFHLQHAQGETDDHTWTWIPEHKAICAGDLFIWNFPNAGNPQKVQRYPLEWAKALRAMAAKKAELFIPAHGLPIAGQQRIERLLCEVAGVLESLVTQVLNMMNQGATLNSIIHTVKVPQDVLERPWMKPLYDEPEFLINNVWRQFGGWYDGNPAHLKPAEEQALGLELTQLAGGLGNLTQRALDLSESGDSRLACHLIEFALAADPKNRETHRVRAEIYQHRRNRETSLMAKGIFGSAANVSREYAEEDA